MTRSLIVNADDFGRSPGINAGVAHGFACGVLRSASLMVRWPAAVEAAAYARAHPRLSVGLHLDLAEWRYDGEWRPVYEVIPADPTPACAEAEIERQLDAFVALVGRPPTHLDSHQHVHRDEPVRSALLAAGEALGIPVRDFSAAVRYEGGFYGQYGRGEPYPEGIERVSLLALLASLPDGVTELGCHPAIAPELESAYAAERPRELRVLCDLRVADAIRAHAIELRSFADLLSTTELGVI
jgi:predicted glycoside hydrolase/deacetylase ChbG (UPF0249 family)